MLGYFNIKMGEIHKCFGYTTVLSIVNHVNAELLRGYTLGQKYGFSTTQHSPLKKGGAGLLFSVTESDFHVSHSSTIC
jgi:hypothetical protein